MMVAIEKVRGLFYTEELYYTVIKECPFLVTDSISFSYPCCVVLNSKISLPIIKFSL